MSILINKEPFSSLTFYKGEISEDSIKKNFQICLDTNNEDKRKKINFYADGSKFTESEKEQILLFFNEKILNNNIDIQNIEE